MNKYQSIKASTCRICSAACPVSVTVENNRVTKVEGNKASPLYKGFICPKGRALEGVHNQDRLKHHLKKQPDGSFAPISSEQLVEEISEKLKALIEKHGPETIASFLGGPVIENPAVSPMITSFMQAVGSSGMYSAATIDQPGIMIAQALHGFWAGGLPRLDDVDTILAIGTNPIVSKQYLGQDPGATLKRLKKKGVKIAVVDPRRNETSRHSELFLQVIPGEDPALLAGLIHLLFEMDAIDQGFVAQNAEGVETLKDAVAAFTPDYVSKRAGVPVDDLRAAATLLAESKMALVWPGIGPSMATRGNLVSYLSLCIQTLRGFWPGEGATAYRHRVLSQPGSPYKAQPNPPYPAWGFGKTSRVRGLQDTVAGPPTGALPEEILTPGKGQVRALFCHGGAALIWPDAELAKKALESLDLMIIHENLASLTPTSELADYVIALKMQFEAPFMTQMIEQIHLIHPGIGYDEPFAAYQEKLFEPPEDADVLDAWQIYYRVAQRLGLQLNLQDASLNPESAYSLDMTEEPTTEELYEVLCRDSVVPLEEVKKFPEGHIFEKSAIKIEARDADCEARFQLADATMISELSDVATESVEQRRGVDDTYRYLFIPRRMQQMHNAQRLPKENLPKLRGYNPAYMNEADLVAMNLKPGDKVRIKSRNGEIVGFVDIDNNLRRGVLSMCHGYGVAAGEKSDPADVGSNVNHLISWEDDFDPYSGMPRMGALPVSVTAMT